MQVTDNTKDSIGCLPGLQGRTARISNHRLCPAAAPPKFACLSVEQSQKVMLHAQVVHLLEIYGETPIERADYKFRQNVLQQKYAAIICQKVDMAGFAAHRWEGFKSQSFIRSFLFPSTKAHGHQVGLQ